MPVSTAELKITAKAALKGHWQTALLIALIVSLPPLLVQAIGIATHNDFNMRLQDILTSYLRSSDLFSEFQFLADLEALIMTPGVWIMLGCSLLTWLATPFLSLGMLNWMQTRLCNGERKEDDKGVTAVFSRSGIFFKAIGLRIITTLKIFLWMLPGAGASMLALLPILLGNPQSFDDISSSISLSMGLTSAASVIMTVFGVLAALRYAMADYIMADRPQTKIMEAIDNSKVIMKDLKGGFFFLVLSFIGWDLLLFIVTNTLTVMFSPVIGLMVNMLLGLFLTVYTRTTFCVFFEMNKSLAIRLYQKKETAV